MKNLLLTLTLLLCQPVFALLNLTQIVDIKKSKTYSEVSYVFLQLPKNLIGSCLNKNGTGIVKTTLETSSGRFDVEILSDGTVKSVDNYELAPLLARKGAHFKRTLDCDVPLITGTQLLEMQDKISYGIEVEHVEAEDFEEIPNKPFNVKNSDVVGARRFGQNHNGPFSFWSGTHNYRYNYAFDTHRSPIVIPAMNEAKFNFDEYTIYHPFFASCEALGNFATPRDAVEAFHNTCGLEVDFLSHVDRIFQGTGKTIVKVRSIY